MVFYNLTCACSPSSGIIGREYETQRMLIILKIYISIYVLCISEVWFQLAQLNCGTVINYKSYAC